MNVQRIDHVGIIVEDLSAAKDFFLEFGLEVQAEWELEGELLERVVALDNAKVACVGLGTSDGETWVELSQFKTPVDENGVQQPHANTLGIRHIAFAVDDIEALVSKLKKKDVLVFSEIQNYEGKYKLCYCRGPEGIILELAEKIS